MQNTEKRLMNIEIALANNEKMVEELNAVVIEQAKKIEFLAKQCKLLKDSMSQEGIKPLSEETPPPHY